MKVRIKKPFRDIDTNRIMRPGNESDYSEERARRLARSGFVEILEAPGAVEETKPVITGSEQETEPAAAGIEEEQGPGEKAEGEHEAEKNEFEPYPEKDEQSGPKKRGRKPKK